MDTRESYDAAADAYAEHLATELEHKPLDRHLLNRFAEAARDRGRVAELGCGPGHVSGYLNAQGVTTLGLDLSPRMVEIARRLHPDLEFRVGDMRRLELAEASLAGIVAFYSIVHFEVAELDATFHEMRRVLVPGGSALVAFHVGDRAVHVDDLFGVPVALDFRFHMPADVVAGLGRARLAVTEHVEREPYAEVEYASRRCYLLARAT